MANAAENLPILAGLFVSVTQTAYDITVTLQTAKRFAAYSIELVQLGATTVNDADILVCQSFQTLLNIKQHLHDRMVVIVCDGPLICSCLHTATALDYVCHHSYKFDFRPVNYDLVYLAVKTATQAREIPQIKLEAVDYDVVGLVTANSMVGGLILTELNKVQSYFDAIARNRLRFLIVQLFDPGDVKPALQQLQSFLSKECINTLHKADAKVLWDKLLKHGALRKLRPAMQDLASGKNLTSVAKKYDISVFELSYLRKMIKNIDSAAARTENYAAATKTLLSNG